MPSSFSSRTTASQVASGLEFSSKTFIVTGCNSGLGLETIKVLASHGATIYGLARSMEKAETALKEAKNANPNSRGFACELTDLNSVRACVKAIKGENRRIDVILCNAGVMAIPTLELVQGIEKQFYGNHIGHFALIHGLVFENDLLTDDGRVVLTSSAAHSFCPKQGIDFDNLDGKKGYARFTAYGQSKVAQILLAQALNKRFQGTKRVAVALHPGVIATNLGRQLPYFIQWFMRNVMTWFVLKTPEQGAATQMYAAVHPDMAHPIKTNYLSDCHETKPIPIALDSELSEKLWARSEKWLETL